MVCREELGHMGKETRGKGNSVSTRRGALLTLSSNLVQRVPLSPAQEAILVSAEAIQSKP